MHTSLLFLVQTVLGDFAGDIEIANVALRVNDAALNELGGYFKRSTHGCATPTRWPLPLSAEGVNELLDSQFSTIPFSPSRCSDAECYTPSEPVLFVVDLLLALGELTNRFVLNVGCALQEETQTVSYDIANALIKDQGWSGIGIDIDTLGSLTRFKVLVAGIDRIVNDPAAFKAARNSGGAPVAALNQRLMANDLSVLQEWGVPHDLDFLKIDIDSVDVVLFEAVLDAGYRPKVVHIEAATMFSENIRFAAKSVMECQGGLVLHSASCAWIHDFAKERDYQVVSSFDIDLTLIDARLPTAELFASTSPEAGGCGRCSGHRLDDDRGGGSALPTKIVGESAQESFSRWRDLPAASIAEENVARIVENCDGEFVLFPSGGDRKKIHRGEESGAHVVCTESVRRSCEENNVGNAAGAAACTSVRSRLECK